MTGPGYPENPRLILVDTSVLLQLIVCNQVGLLRRLRQEYGVQPTIVEAVEAEAAHKLECSPKFMGRQDQLRKALNNGALRLLNEDVLRDIVSGHPKIWIEQIESESERFHLFVDRGEAHTHAASTILDMPIATGDMSAVNRLLRERIDIPRPILRFWDIVVFALQTGALDHSTCDHIRQSLGKIGDRTLPCFTGRSFVDGLKSFFPRLMDSTRSVLGAADPQERFDERRFVRPVHPASQRSGC